MATIDKTYLKRIIREEVAKVLREEEAELPVPPPAGSTPPSQDTQNDNDLPFKGAQFNVGQQKRALTQLDFYSKRLTPGDLMEDKFLMTVIKTNPSLLAYWESSFSMRNEESLAKMTYNYLITGQPTRSPPENK